MIWLWYILWTTIPTIFVSVFPEYTDDDVLCKNKCQKDGESYNWCSKGHGWWGYCTPSLYCQCGITFILKFSQKSEKLFFSRFRFSKINLSYSPFIVIKSYFLYLLLFPVWVLTVASTRWLEATVKTHTEKRSRHKK